MLFRCAWCVCVVCVRVQRVKEIAEMESLQTGRAIKEMYAQLSRLPEWLEYFAAIAATAEGSVPPFKGSYVNYVRRVPLGVVAQITPWVSSHLSCMEPQSLAFSLLHPVPMRCVHVVLCSLCCVVEPSFADRDKEGIACVGCG